MAAQVQHLIPDRKHYAVTFEEGIDVPGASMISVPRGSAFSTYRRLRGALRRFRIGMAPVLFTQDRAFAPLRGAAFLLAPRKILAFNSRLERHHLRLRTAIASWLFARGVPLDRIFLRPSWLFPWRKERSVVPGGFRELAGRPCSPLRRRAAVLSPYFPYPLSHGGAVRIFNLLREAAREFDVFLFAFSEGGVPEETAPVLEFCAKVALVDKPRYREPRWASFEPPEVREYRSPAMQDLWERLCLENGVEVRQVEYTQLASYGGDILVEHDVTFDLYRQVYEQERTRSAWWNWWRWQRFEKRVVAGYHRVIAMSDKDSWLLGLAQGRLALPNVRIVPNGVDLDRFCPEPEASGQRLLFIGSFRHFPNVVAYRFFAGEVWPLLRERFPEMTVTVVAGPAPLLYWREHADSPAPAGDPRIRMLEFVPDVRPLYMEANVVVVPTLVSAGTNVKVLEAMAMQRAVVSTSSGCAGLGLRHPESVWIADTAAEFAGGIERLVSDPGLRGRIAQEARRYAEAHFDWKALGVTQREIWREVASAGLVVRPAGEEDLFEIERIRQASPEAVAWETRSYLHYDCSVAEVGGRVVGFAVTRKLAHGESEILNLAVDPAFRRHGVATSLLREAMAASPGTWFLEVRESNAAARKLYDKFGFHEVARRPGYYRDSSEDAVVMRMQS
jgi:ribosomal-protein-alanine acetyltransferase